MGLYGSPDLSRSYEYTDDKIPTKKKKIKINMQVAVLSLIFLMMIWVADDKYYTTISFAGVVSIVYFIIYFIKMIIKLFKKETVNNDVIKQLICVGIITICLILG